MRRPIYLVRTHAGRAALAACSLPRTRVVALRRVHATPAAAKIPATEMVKEVAGKVNKKVGKGLAGVIEEVEGITGKTKEKTKEVLGASKEKTEEAKQKAKQTAEQAEKKDELKSEAERRL